MQREKKIVIVSHCILNVNAKVYGIAKAPGALAIVKEIIDDGVGLIQLPCPEMLFSGCKRWGMSREQYDTPVFRRHCARLLRPIVDQVEDYLASGYAILGIIGLDGSPSCGVSVTNSGYTGGSFRCGAVLQSYSIVSGSGVYMEVLEKLLLKAKVPLPMVGLNEFDPQQISWQKVKSALQQAREA
ncbi:CD3072 family TudS-related putative desulfidase [Brenneria sp. g21c3]|uniref:CD3072 family TudS-related putative desulfidase n=1 Tax=Brenneria sp. g21c3 TaxID=3093893 RepID=UPI002EB78D33|nr:CD3072 family TudS-related putative desulfidase [Brenneria sp. g21c3]